MRTQYHTEPWYHWDDGESREQKATCSNSVERTIGTVGRSNIGLDQLWRQRRAGSHSTSRIRHSAYSACKSRGLLVYRGSVLEKKYDCDDRNIGNPNTSAPRMVLLADLAGLAAVQRSLHMLRYRGQHVQRATIKSLPPLHTMRWSQCVARCFGKLCRRSSKARPAELSLVDLPTRSGRQQHARRRNERHLAAAVVEQSGVRCKHGTKTMSVTLDLINSTS